MLLLFRIYISFLCFKKILCGIQDSEVNPLHPSRWRGYYVWTFISQATSVQTAWLFRQSCIHSDVSATRPNSIQCSTSKRISFADIDMGRQLQLSGQQVYTVRTQSLIKQDVEQICNSPDASPYYGNCVQLKCNCPDCVATPSECCPIQERIPALLESRLHS